MQIEPSRARSIADATDAYDAEIAKLQEGKRDTFEDLRTELGSNGLDRATVRAEIASLKAAIAIRAKRRKDDAAEEREALTDDYLDALTCAPRATYAREADDHQNAQRPSNRDVSAVDEPSSEAGPQAEASLAGTGSETLAGREGYTEGQPGPNAGRDVRTVPPIAKPIDLTIPAFLDRRQKPQAVEA